MDADRHRLTVGLTGGIGCGKSAVADRLAARGAAVIDADRIAHALTGPGGAAIAPIRAAFGASMIGADGALDRPRMRALVFADAAQRERLQAILHPLIGAELWRQADRAAGPYRVLVLPLLVENLTRWRSRLDRIAVVHCDPQRQVERVIARSGLDRDQVLAIIAAQAQPQQRLQLADDVIQNDDDLASLMLKTDQLHDQYSKIAKGV